MYRFIIYCGTYILLMPILTLAHELGHSIFVLLLTNNNAYIEIGNRNLNIEKKIGRLKFKFKGYKTLFDLPFGMIRFNLPKSKFIMILILLGGPLTSLIICILSSLIILLFPNLSLVINIILKSISIYSLTQFLITILPINYKFYPYKLMSSDGYKILQIIKEK